MSLETLFELGVDEMSWDDTVSLLVCAVTL